MFYSKVARGLVIAASLFAVTTRCDLLEAREGFWQGDVSTDWNTAGNWFVVGAPGDGSFVPRANGGYNVRAIVGTDSPNGALNTTLGNSPVISAVLPVNNQSIGGLYLGLRQLDYTFNPPQFVNTAPAAGALVGKLTISAGTLNNVSTSESAVGADGAIVVGADGRGFLTMTGGTLTGQTLSVGGENYTNDALGTSMLDLSGSATLTINNSASAINGSATFNRRLRITGPSVNFTATGPVRFNSSNDFTAVITGPTTHAMVQSGAAAFLGGNLNVQFSGAGATHSLGATWDLVDATTGVAGNFSNLGLGDQVTVSGLPSGPPSGSAYFIRKTNGSNDHKLVQLSYEGVLVLNVNRDTGELKVTNPLGGSINIDGYTVRSGLGSMKNTYNGITTDSGWTSPGLNPNTGLPLNDAFTLTQWKQTGTYNVTGIGATGISLGSGFNRQAVAGNISNFGIDGEDLIFEYTSPNGGVKRGQIVYQGAKFENDLVLRVNPNTGQAFIKNDSLQTLKFDGYSILSSTGNLNGAGFTGLGGTWQTTSPATTNAITQTNLTNFTTLAPGAQLAIGDISSLNFTTAAAQAGLSIQYILAQGLVSTAPSTDYNGNGAVDAADYAIWRNNLGITGATQAQGDGNGDGNVTQADYDLWRSQFGSTGVAAPETTYRTGSVFFDATAGAGSGAPAGGAVPEPGAALLMGLGLAVLSNVRRKNRNSENGNKLGANGGIAMKMQTQLCLLIASVAVVLIASRPAAAVTQGIPLTNFDFELPGPVNTKTVAFDSTGAPLNNIPGWTFPGPGVEDFGHTNHAGGDALGDSGTEGGGNPGNEMILSMLDGVAFQTSGFSVVGVPNTQAYRLTFDAHNIFTVLADGAPTYTAPQTQLTARLYFLAANGTTRTTIGAPLVINNVDAFAKHSLDIMGGSAALTPALGRPLGVEFDVTSNLFNPTYVQHSWIGVDNVTLQIAGVLAGDFNGDGAVDLTDYGIVRDRQQQTQLYNAQGEMTGDAFVNLNDFRAFRTAYEAVHGSGSLAAALAAVPEPTSLVLASLLLVGGLATLRSRKSSAGRPLAILAALALALGAAPASATQLFYDPFLIGNNPAAGQYTVGALAGQNPLAPFGTQRDFFTGPWAVRSADSAPNGQVKAAPGLSFIGAPAQGGSAGAVPVPDNTTANTRVGRYVKTESRFTDATVGTYYVSWLESFGSITNPTDDMGFRTMELYSATGTVGLDSSAIGYVGYNAYYSSFPDPLGSQQRAAATARMTFSFGSPGALTHQIIENSPANFREDGATHLIVLKFVLSDQANSDTVSLYLDPTTATEPDLPGASFSGQNITFGAMGVSQFGGVGPTYNTIDEIRVSDSWVDSVPNFPLPGDTDNDGDVDLVDYNNIVSHMNMSVGSALLGDVAKADGTQGADGRVTIADFRIWKDHYPTPAAGSGALGNSNVPEPASGVLLLMAVIFAVSNDRRRIR